MTATRLAGGLGVVAACALAYGWFEAGWVRLRRLEVPIEGLPPELDGLRIAHLSDFHLGIPSRGAHAVERAVEWTAARDPDLTVVTGDLLTRQRGLPQLRRALARLPRCYAILGNHDLDDARDPFSEPVALGDLPVVLLADESRTIELRGRLVQIAGVEPHHRSSRPIPDTDPEADLRILLVHFPSAIDRLPPDGYDLVLAGHMHDGQICIPYPGGKLRLAHPSARYTSGLYRRPGGVLHVSPGLGTTFVPFRFCARPEATELVLQSV